jgi:hypothetical protein
MESRIKTMPINNKAICQDEERRLSTELENMLDVMTSAEEQEEEEAGKSSSKK